MKKTEVGFIILIGSWLNFFFFLDECYSAHLSIDVHCSKSAKFYGFDSTVVSLFCYIGGAKITL